MASEQLELDWRPDVVVEARCGCARSGREVCPACGDCRGPGELGGCCRCARPAASSAAVRQGGGSRTALGRTLLDTLATWHGGREVRR